MAAAVQRVARWRIDSSDHEWRIRSAESRVGVRRAVRRRRGQRGRMDLLHRVARRADAALSLSLAARRNGEGRARDAGGADGDASLQRSRRADSSRCTPTRRSRRRRCIEIVRLPSHAVVRTLADNAALRARLASLSRGQGAIRARARARRHAAQCVGDDATRTSIRRRSIRCCSPCTASRHRRR